MFLTAMALAGQIVTTSPDKLGSISISPDGTEYSVRRKGEVLIDHSPLGLQMADGDFQHLAMTGVKSATHKQTLPLHATKANHALDWYNSNVVTFHEDGGAGRTLRIEVRAYNDGVAFRYLLPDTGPVAVKDESTAFLMPGDVSCEVSEYVSFHENTWQPLKLSQMPDGKAYDVPAVCASSSGKSWLAITQARLDGYSGSSLVAVKGGLKVHLIPRVDQADVAVTSPKGLTSAWRVVMMADRAGDLIQSNLVGNLADQAQGDYGWVKPGKAAWDWWSGPASSPSPTMERYRRFIDFAGQNGFPYFLVDAGWALNGQGCCDARPDTDITRPDPAIDMPALVKYAADRGVGLLLWVHWKHIEPRMDEVLDTYQKWGIKGIKVDFMMRDDQDMVDFYQRLAAATAKRHMLLDMHGAFPPMGLARTYPNYITQEGVLGAEYNKFDTKRVTASHNVRLAYTRMLLGPMDYTPGGFRNTTPDHYVPQDVMPITQTTRGQGIAQYVVYDSPLQMVSDDPSAYVNAPGFDFVKQVPTAWDEMRFIGGTPETYVAVARRSGTKWYIGVISNEEGRTVDIPLSFLGKGSYTADVWQDGATPMDVVRTSQKVTRGKTLHFVVAGSGGGVAILSRDSAH